MKRLLKIIASIDPMTKSKENPFFKSKYFDINILIEKLKPIFLKEGLVIMQPLTEVNGRPAIKTTVSDIETGEIVFSDIFPLPDLTDPQKMGSAITYYRRQTLKSLLFLSEVDDDGNQKEKPVIDTTSAIDKLAGVKTMDELNKVWASLSAKERKDEEVMKLASFTKKSLTQQKNAGQ